MFREGTFSGEAVVKIEDLATHLMALYKQRFPNHPIINIIIESRDKRVLAINYDMKTDEYHGMSSSQTTHWKGMNYSKKEKV